jgi:hypothetical protein
MMENVLLAVGGGAGTATITEVGQRFRNAKNGKYTAKEDFTYHDHEGNSREVKKGEHLNIPEGQRKSFKENYGDKVKARAGSIGGLSRGSADKLEKLIEPLSQSSESSLNGPNKPSNTHSQNKTADKPNDVPYNKSPIFNDNADYTIDPTKTSSPQEQIKTQADNDRAKVRSIDPQDAGKMQMRSDLDAAAKHYPKDAPEQTRIRQMQDALDHGESIKAESFKE